jgi:hypothetical protein
MNKSISNKYQALLFIVLLGISSTGCEKIVDLDIRTQDRKLVLNSVLTPDSLLQLNLFLSQGILEDDKLLTVSDAEVEIFEEGVSMGTFRSGGNGIYISNIKPQPDKNYLLKARMPSGQITEAQTRIPVSPLIGIKDTSTSLSVDEWMGTELNFYISLIIKDPPHVNNYYMVKLIQESSAFYDSAFPPLNDEVYGQLATKSALLELYESYPGEFRQVENSGNLDFGGKNGTEYTGISFIFSDASFDGKDFIFPFFTGLYYVGKPNYRIQVSSLSEDYYLYIKSLALYTSAQEDFFAEKVKVYSNVRNGFGMVAAYSSSSLTIQMPERTNPPF